MRALAALNPFWVGYSNAVIGEFYSAQEAYRIGLVNQVVPGDTLMATALAFAEKINENAPLAVRAVKEGAMGAQVPLSEALKFETLLLSRVRQSEDSWEGPRAFSEKGSLFTKAGKTKGDQIERGKTRTCP